MILTLIAVSHTEDKRLLSFWRTHVLSVSRL